MHLKRWLTGIVAIPVLIYIIGPGPRWLFHVLIFLASIVGLSEFFGFTAPKLRRHIKVAIFVLAFFLFYFITRGLFFMTLATISLWAIIPLILCLFSDRSHRGHDTEDIGKILLGLIYIPLPLSLLVFMRNHPKGDIWIFFLLAVIFIGDTGAFYFGRFFGKHKLYEVISPGKTWEGAFGGLLCAIITALWFLKILRLHQVDLSVLALVLALPVSGQLGDLAESMLKRNYGVKDSGKILPGHGGILDRIDGLLFSIPILYTYLTWS